MSNGKTFRLALSILLLVGLLAACAPAQVRPEHASDSSPPDSAIGAFGAHSLRFAPNLGQLDAQVLFSAVGAGSRLFFTSDAVSLVLPAVSTVSELLDRTKTDVSHLRSASLLRLRFEGTSRDSRIVGEERLRGVVNYYVGNDPSRWRTGVPTYSSLRYRDLYPGIDLVYHGQKGALESVYLIAPGADPDAIRWRYEGASDVDLHDGELLLRMGDGAPSLVVRRPAAWQTVDGARVPVRVRYVAHRDGTIGFALGRYDRSRPLVIDPTLDYHTYLGGGGDESASDIALDARDNLYITGLTDSSDFPPNDSGSTDSDWNIFVTKMDLSRTGANQLIYTTIIGGKDFDITAGMDVDAAGNVYLSGETDSDDFPTTANAYQRTHLSDRDGIVVQLDTSGAVRYSSYLGGGDWDELMRVAVENGLMYVVGFTSSDDFPTTTNAYRSTRQEGDAVVSVVDPSKSGAASLVYSTFYGGSGLDEAWVVAVSGGIIYFAGDTQSTDLPLKNPIQDALGAGRALDGFLVRLDPSRSGDDQLLFSTYLGGDGEEYSGGLAVDESGTAYWGGVTASQDFPTTDGSPAFGGEYDAFLAKVDTVNSKLVYSRLIGGSHREGISDLVIDAKGNVYATGGTGSDDFPLVDPIRSTFLGGKAAEQELQGLGPGDPFVAKFDATGKMVFGTYLGGSGGDAGLGIALASDGSVYVAGGTNSSDLALVDPIQNSKAGTDDLFIVRLRGLGLPSLRLYLPLVHE